MKNAENSDARLIFDLFGGILYKENDVILQI
jgi:hypothetical protein